MEAYAIYAEATGELITATLGYEGSSQSQPLEDGWAVLVIPKQALRPLGQVDLDTVKASYAGSIDADADKVRSMFITNTPGQMATYLEKEQEARRVLAGDATPTVFLAAEAAALGTTVPQLAQEVVDQADQWRPIGARIEAARRKAKVDVAQAENLSALAAAALIDWSAIISPA